MATRLKGYAEIALGSRSILAMKVIIILASLFALAPVVRAETIVVRHEPTVVVHEHYTHHYHYAHHYNHAYHNVVVVHHN
jgi:hypothetical protein